MKFTNVLILSLASTVFLACGTATRNTEDYSSKPENTKQTIAIVERPESIKEEMKNRGKQDSAAPELLVSSPKDGETIVGSVVKVKVQVIGDIKMGKDDNGTGNHVHVILDNQPYAAHYMWNEGFELRNVADGEHTLRMFASRPWHESYKNEKAFKTIKFSVKNGNADEGKPTTDSNGQKLADAKTSEGTEVKKSKAGPVDFAKPLLTYSRPKGNYKGKDAEAIMIDFWLANAKLTSEGGEYNVSYTINGGEPRTIKKWAPIWLKGWKNGENTIKLELVDKNGKLAQNGDYNSTTRKITITK